MKTMDKGQAQRAHAPMHFLQMHPHGHAIDNNLERFATSAVLVPLLIVLLTIITMSLQYFLMINTNGHWPANLPTFVDVPFAQFK